MTDLRQCLLNSVLSRVKNKVGVKTVRFVQYRDGTKGIIPQI